MKYYFGFFGRPDCIVSGSIDDIGDVISRAVKMGCPCYLYDEADVLQNYREYVQEGDFNEDDYLDYLYDCSLEYIADLNAYVLVDCLYWEPAPPNVREGVLTSEGPKYMRFRQRQ